MVAKCPHCGEIMNSQGKSHIVTGATGYYCTGCGQHYTKVSGEVGYHKGQPINLVRKYFERV